MLKQLAVVAGIVLVTIGALGFVPSLTEDGMVMGLFQVTPVHNFLYLVSGAAAIWAGLTSAKHSRLFFQVFGVVYGLVALAGFFVGDTDTMGIVATDQTANLIRVAIAAAALVIGYVVKDEEAPTTVRT